MNNIFILSILGCISLGLSLIFTRILVSLLPKYGIVDIPGNRRAHLHCTPRGAGFGFVVAFSLLLPIFEYYTFSAVTYSRMLLQALLPIAAVSFWDDIACVSVPVRLCVHTMCSLLAVVWFIHPNQLPTLSLIPIPMWLDLVIRSFMLLAFINFYNFLDGIDGITASETIHLTITIIILCLFSYSTVYCVDMIIAICIIILFWSIGFLYFNWPPAQVFLGDVGSISIGFLLGICLLTVAASDVKLFIACIIASLYYIADGGLTILIRLVKGEKIWEPHLQHFFQKSVRRGNSHKIVVTRIIFCNCTLMLLAIGALYYPIISMIGAVVSVGIVLLQSSI